MERKKKDSWKEEKKDEKKRYEKEKKKIKFSIQAFLVRTTTSLQRRIQVRVYEKKIG